QRAVKAVAREVAGAQDAAAVEVDLVEVGEGAAAGGQVAAGVDDDLAVAAVGRVEGGAGGGQRAAVGDHDLRRVGVVQRHRVARGERHRPAVRQGHPAGELDRDVARHIHRRPGLDGERARKDIAQAGGGGADGVQGQGLARQDAAGEDVDVLEL